MREGRIVAVVIVGNVRIIRVMIMREGRIVAVVIVGNVRIIRVMIVIAGRIKIIKPQRHPGDQVFDGHSSGDDDPVNHVMQPEVDIGFMIDDFILIERGSL